MSARLSIRLPEGLARLIADRASIEGVSQNQLAVSLLAGALGWRPEEIGPPTKKQLAFFHALCDERDEALKLADGTTKKEQLDHAGETFGKPVVSANDMDVFEVSMLIDDLKASRARGHPRRRVHGSRR